MKLKILKVSQLHAYAEQKNRGWLLEPWLRERQACMIYAPTGLGKSMLALSMGICVAGQGRFIGWSASKKPKRVLVVDGEMDTEDLSQRTKLLTKSIENIEDATIEDNLFVLARHAQEADEPFPDLNTESGRKYILDMVKKGRIELVILDNFSTLAEITNENDAHSFNGFLSLLKTLKQLDCASILVHHSTKGNDTYRGTSKIGVIFDSIIRLQPNLSIQHSSDLAFDLYWEKVRMPKEESMRTITVKLAQEDGLPSWSVLESEEDELNKIVNMVKTLNFTTDKAIADAVGIAASTLSKKKRQIFAKDLMSEHKWDECMRYAKDNVVDDNDGRYIPDFDAKTKHTETIDDTEEDIIPSFAARNDSKEYIPDEVFGFL